VTQRWLQPGPGRVGSYLHCADGAAAAGLRGAFFRKRQNSERLGADRRNYSRSRSHLRAVVAMIGMKSPGLDGGVRGVCAKTGTCSWGRAVPAYTTLMGRAVSQGRHRLGPPGWRPRFLDRNKDAGRRVSVWRIGSEACSQPRPSPQPHFLGAGASISSRKLRERLADARAEAQDSFLAGRRS
jgi:hypothetical protein